MATTPSVRIKVRQPVRDWFTANPGIVIHGSALAAELGLSEHLTAVLTACSTLAAEGVITGAGRKGQYICTTPSRSHKRQTSAPAVQYQSVILPAGTYLTVIEAKTSDGYQLAVCEDNRLWKLVLV